jgi:hypothetical protein
MGDTATQIKNLLETSGKAAPAMTTALKKIGGGSMQTGIAAIADFFAKEGIKLGTVRGAVGGAVGTAALGGLILLVSKIVKEQRAHNAEGEAILEALESNIAEEESLGAACDTVSEDNNSSGAIEADNEKRQESEESL